MVGSKKRILMLNHKAYKLLSFNYINLSPRYDFSEECRASYSKIPEVFYE